MASLDAVLFALMRRVESVPVSDPLAVKAATSTHTESMCWPVTAGRSAFGARNGSAHVVVAVRPRAAVVMTLEQNARAGLQRQKSRIHFANTQAPFRETQRKQAQRPEHDDNARLGI